MSFNFGTSTPKTAATGFTLPTNPTTTAASGGFQLSSGAGDTKNQPQNKQMTSLFASPAPANPAANAPINFGFGTAKTTASVLTFPSVTTGTTAPTFGTLATGNTPAPTLSFGTPAPSSSAPSLSFGAAVSTSAPSLTTQATAVTTSSIQFSFGPKPTTTVSASFTPILGGSTGTTTAIGTTLGTSITPTTTSTTALSFGLPSTSTALSLGGTPATSQPASTGALTATSITTTPLLQSTSSLTFSQLEDTINKWTIDLEEQGKFFINQAKQLNAWDSLLISNGEKILNLNASIERVKQQQQQLDQELDFIVAQQKELEELLRPLEKELVDLPVTDIDRNQMYQFSEIIDSQLKQMSDDLKEIIEHINETNKNEEVSNPVTQISRILNAHMNSLQWIDRNTAQISGQLEQITKMQDSNRRNFSLNHSLNHSFNM